MGSFLKEVKVENKIAECQSIKNLTNSRAIFVHCILFAVIKNLLVSPVSSFEESSILSLNPNHFLLV